MNRDRVARIEKCLRIAKPGMVEIWERDGLKVDAHLHFDYGLDSLDYQRLVLALEEEFGIAVEEDMHKSGFFASIEGIETYLGEYHMGS